MEFLYESVGYLNFAQLEGHFDFFHFIQLIACSLAEFLTLSLDSNAQQTYSEYTSHFWLSLYHN